MATLITIIASLLLACAGLQAQVTAIKAGKLIDTDAGAVLSNQIILVKDGKIEAVGAEVSIPPGARVIDLTGMTVLPGLIDCHTHLTDSYADSDPLSELRKTAAVDAFASTPTRNPCCSPDLRLCGTWARIALSSMLLCAMPSTAAM